MRTTSQLLNCGVVAQGFSITGDKMRTPPLNASQRVATGA